MPTEPVSPPVTSCTWSLSRGATAVTPRDGEVRELGGRGQVDERLVERQRLHQRRQLAQQRHDGAAGLAVGVEPPGEVRRVRAPRRAPRGSTSPSARRTPAPRTTRWRPRRGRRPRRPRPACRAATACRAARRRRRTRPGRRGGSSGRRSSPRGAEEPGDALGTHSSCRAGPGAAFPMGTPSPAARSARSAATRAARWLPMTEPKTLTVRTPEDILALVPYVLGFTPEDSVVLLTAGDVAEPFHARIDLPDDPADLDLVVAPLVEAAARNDARQAMIVLYTHDSASPSRPGPDSASGLRGVGVVVAVSLRADAGCYVVLDDADTPRHAVRRRGAPLAAGRVRRPGHLPLSAGAGATHWSPPTPTRSRSSPR